MVRNPRAARLVGFRSSTGSAAGSGLSEPARAVALPLAPVVLADRPDHLIVIDAVAQERSAQDGFAGGAQLLQRAVAAAVADGRARFQPVDADLVKTNARTCFAAAWNIPVPQKLEPMANPHSAMSKPAPACAPG